MVPRQKIPHTNTRARTFPCQTTHVHTRKQTGLQRAHGTLRLVGALLQVLLGGDQLLHLLETLDKASLAEKRSLSIPFVKEALGW